MIFDLKSNIPSFKATIPDFVKDDCQSCQCQSLQEYWRRMYKNYYVPLLGIYNERKHTIERLLEHQTNDGYHGQIDFLPIRAFDGDVSKLSNEELRPLILACMEENNKLRWLLHRQTEMIQYLERFT